VAYAAPAAEADPEADPALLYSSLAYPSALPYSYSTYAARPLAYNAWPYANLGYNTYAAAAPWAYNYGYARYAYNPYNSYFGARLIKREAEADPEADPALLYSSLAYPTAAYSAYAASPLAYRAATWPFYNNYLGYRAYASPLATAAYTAPLATSAYAYTPYAYGAYSNYFGARLIKREAEADPEADPALLYSSLGYASPAALTYGASVYANPIYSAPALTTYRAPLATPFAYSSYAYNPLFARPYAFNNFYGFNRFY